ncbi:gdh [Symbiodinium necroappetens]|uniref:Gdh protein n=1 Tax=Symbiodinium necroappetens TaxID=1628268 RepID=A0A812MUS0_9DINO|nr:gdh [Symbiodinium necroappetens]
MGEFDGKHCVVTGGTGALGSAVVARILELGGSCAVPVYDESELDGFAHASDDRVALTVGVDLADESAATSFYADVSSSGLWASVHVAGGFAMSGITETSLDDLRAMMAKNAETCFVCCREAVRAMRAAGSGGRIVNVSARPAVQPCGGMLAYQMSKAAVASLTQGLAEEVKDDGILVNAVLPSIMDTPANRDAMPDADFDAWPKVEQVAEAMCFLASPGNALTSGALVPVYGMA